MSDEHEIDGRVTRRAVMTAIVGAGATFALGCGDDDTSGVDAGTSGSGGTSAGAGASGRAGAGGARAGNGGAGAAAVGGQGGSSTAGNGGSDADAGACEVTPEGEIGPYFADDSASGFNRSDVLANIDGTSVQDGIPLKLTVTVLDTQKDCAPLAGSQVDIWHCNAAGIYSDQAVENTSSESWLRGYQTTDSKGQLVFNTIIPGWYQGRTTHIHLRIRSSYSDASSTSDGTNTTQLFFDQDLVDRLATSVDPYNKQGKNSTTNAGDHVYSGETNGANLLALDGNDSDGYTTSITIYLPITNEATSTNSGMGMGPMGMGMPPGAAGH
ncbi:MAG TPA: hypothetical protein VGI70_06580 [Polyangiales bacterium]|jgi:protocatechuate 3,4-dioxygenase beta subunit